MIDNAPAIEAYCLDRIRVLHIAGRVGRNASAEQELRAVATLCAKLHEIARQYAAAYKPTCPNDEYLPTDKDLGNGAPY